MLGKKLNIKNILRNQRCKEIQVEIKIFKKNEITCINMLYLSKLIVACFVKISFHNYDD